MYGVRIVQPPKSHFLGRKKTPDRRPHTAPAATNLLLTATNDLSSVLRDDRPQHLCSEGCVADDSSGARYLRGY